jgi:hypothetical protein
VIEDELVVPLLVRLEGDLPDTQVFDALRIEAPFWARQSTVVLKLRPATSDGSAEEVARLYGMLVSSISDEDLPEHYQKVRATAAKRMQALAGLWDELSDWDVQSVYIYLQTVRELNERTFVVPPADISSAITWMENASAHQSDRVGKALRAARSRPIEEGLAKARQAIEQVKNAEAVRFGRVWNHVVTKDNCDDRLPLLRAYRDLVIELPIGERRQRVVQVTGVPLGIVENSIAECLSVEVRCHENVVEQPEAELTKMIGRLSTELGTTSDPELKSSLESHRQSLRNLRDDREAGRPMVCLSSEHE